MPTAFPDVWPSSVEVVPARAQIATVSPSSLGTQVQDRGGRRWQITVRCDRLGRTKAELLCAFIHALGGMAGTFEFDLTPWCPGVSPAPGTRVFRLSSPTVGWSARGAVEFTCQFAAVEVPREIAPASAIASAEAFGAATVANA